MTRFSLSFIHLIMVIAVLVLFSWIFFGNAGIISAEEKNCGEERKSCVGVCNSRHIWNVVAYMQCRENCTTGYINCVHGGGIPAAFDPTISAYSADEAYSCHVSYDGGGNFHKGIWEPSDPSRICHPLATIEDATFVKGSTLSSTYGGASVTKGDPKVSGMTKIGCWLMPDLCLKRTRENSIAQ